MRSQLKRNGRISAIARRRRRKKEIMRKVINLRKKVRVMKIMTHMKTVKKTMMMTTMMMTTMTTIRGTRVAVAAAQS